MIVRLSETQFKELIGKAKDVKKGMSGTMATMINIQIGIWENFNERIKNVEDKLNIKL